MKAVILAGGLGTRISEETHLKPKPMVEIGDMPILWHIMKIYSSFNVNEFIICCGYKGYVIKEYFANYFLHMSDVTFDISRNQMSVHNHNGEPWKVTLIDTGSNTSTGGRLKRVYNYVKNDNEFCFTYGDGLSDININELIMFHQHHKKLATVTSVRPPGRWGALNIDNNNLVIEFTEKPKGDGGFINGGFFVLSPECIKYIVDDNTSWESTPLISLASSGQLMSFQHDGFWQSMDTLRDKKQLEDLWASGNAPWKCW